MFIIWGSTWRYKPKADGLRVKKMCPECEKTRDLFEVIPTKYFTVFWIPIAPTQTKKPLLECSNCHERFYIQGSDYLTAITDLSASQVETSRATPLPESQEVSTPISIAVCDRCGQKLRIPKNSNVFRVKCPSCRNTFDFQNGRKV